jgi:hypothetical protein
MNKSCKYCFLSSLGFRRLGVQTPTLRTGVGAKPQLIIGLGVGPKPCAWGLRESLCIGLGFRRLGVRVQTPTLRTGGGGQTPPQLIMGLGVGPKPCAWGLRESLCIGFRV